LILECVFAFKIVHVTVALTV